MSLSDSVVSDSLWPPYSPWNCPGQNTGVGNLSLLQGSQPRDCTQVSRIAGGFFTSWATREAHIIYKATQNYIRLIRNYVTEKEEKNL